MTPKKREQRQYNKREKRQVSFNPSDPAERRLLEYLDQDWVNVSGLVKACLNYCIFGGEKPNLPPMEGMEAMAPPKVEPPKPEPPKVETVEVKEPEPEQIREPLVQTPPPPPPIPEPAPIPQPIPQQTQQPSGKKRRRPSNLPGSF